MQFFKIVHRRIYIYIYREREREVKLRENPIFNWIINFVPCISFNF